MNNEPYDPTQHPYPQWIHFGAGRESVLVQDKDEHDALLAAEKPVTVDLTDEEKSALDAQRQELFDEAKARGLKPHPKAGIEKLKALLAAAE